MSARKCRCGSSQNSHQALIAKFGEGTPLTPPPHAQIIFPTIGTPVSNGFAVHVSAGSQRGIAKVELFFNGSRWMVERGAKFGVTGQADPGTYTFQPPPTLPDGTLDIVAKVSDDLGLSVDTTIVTVTKGEPCTTSETCAAGQSCDTGRCVWPAPVGELGDTCTYAQYCKSWTCLGAGERYCTQECATDEPTSCPDGFECQADGSSPTAGFCWPADTGGCCSASRGNGVWFHMGMAGLVFGCLRRRRNR